MQSCCDVKKDKTDDTEESGETPQMSDKQTAVAGLINGRRPSCCLFVYISLYDSSPHASLKPNLTPKTIKNTFLGAWIYSLAPPRNIITKLFID